MTIPPRITYEKLIEMLRQGGERVQDEGVPPPPRLPGAPRPPLMRRIVRRAGRDTYAYVMTVDPLPPSGNYREFEIDVEMEIPVLRRALRLSRTDGVTDDEFYKYLSR